MIEGGAWCCTPDAGKQHRPRDDSGQRRRKAGKRKRTKGLEGWENENKEKGLEEKHISVEKWQVLEGT